MGFNLDNYVDVPERIRRFKGKFPEGFLTSEVIYITDEVVVVKAYAHTNDGRAATGLAAERIPGKTTFTKDSEVMNAETSAWGRAIAALGFDFGAIASREEVRNRRPDNASSEADQAPDERFIL